MLHELIDNPEVLNIYQYGSRVYGCFTDESDYDYMVIVTDDYKDFIDNIELDDNHFNFYKLSLWQDMVNRNTIEALECLFVNKKFIIKESVEFDIAINQVELRKSISKVCSNSYDKCRKKLIIEKDLLLILLRKVFGIAYVYCYLVSSVLSMVKLRTIQKQINSIRILC